MLISPLLGQTLGDANTSFVLAEWTDDGSYHGPENSTAPLHLHRNDGEVWYVLEGTLGFQIGDQTFEAHAGSAVLAPRGIPHTYWNARPEPARYLLLMTPKTHALIQAIHASEDRSPERMRQLFEEHDCELL